MPQLSGLRLIAPLLIGITLGEVLALPLWLPLIALAMGGGLTLYRHSPIFPLCTTLTFGVLLATLNNQEQPQIIGESEMVLYLEDETTARLEALRLADGDWTEQDAQLRLHTDSLELKPHTRIMTWGAITPFDKQSERQYNQYMLHQHYDGFLKIDNETIIPLAEKISPYTKLQRAAVQRIERLELNPTSRAIVSAMVLADSSLVGEEQMSRYRHSGIVHLLVVSGLHILIVLYIISLITKPLALIRHGVIWRNTISLLLIWLYIALVGFEPSAVRAAVMFSLTLCTYHFGGGRDIINSLLAAATIMICADCFIIYNIGFQLSFIAVLAIALWGIPLTRAIRSRYWLLNTLTSGIAIGACVTAALSPLMLYYFSEIAWLGPLATTIVMIPAYLIITCSLLALLIPCAPLGFIITHSCATLEFVAQQLSTLECTTIELHLTKWSMITIYLCLFSITFLVYRIRKRSEKTRKKDYDLR